MDTTKDNTITTNTTSTTNNTNTTKATTEGTATIENRNNPGPTLKISNITNAGSLQNTTGTPGCSVSMDTKRKTLTINYKDGKEKCIKIKITDTKTEAEAAGTVDYGHIFTEGFDTSKVHLEVVSPTLMVIVVIMKSKQIYDPYVFMGNWGGKHNEDKADGYLKLTPKNSGNYNSGSKEITLTISSATYKTATNNNDQPLKLSPGGTLTLKLTSKGEINNCSGTHNLTPGNLNLTLNLTAEDPSFNGKAYNVTLKIEEEITLTSCTSNCTLKKTTDPVSLGTYKLSGGDNTIQGNPDKHDGHKSTKCCFFGNQYTWSNTNSCTITIAVAKAGTKDTDPGKLRKLAKDLHEKANNLATAVTGGDGKAEAQDLAAAVGANESDTNKLRKALKELLPGTDPSNLTTKANDVKDKYETVKDAYEKVQAQNGQKKYTSQQQEYQAVVNAWNAFNDVYRPEELLKDAVGKDESSGDTLRKALKQLNEEGNGELTQMSIAVKNQYGIVKHRFQLVQAQESAYAQGANIKSDKYDPLKTAWDNFNNKYHDAISREKFYVTIVLSIISMIKIGHLKPNT